MTDDFRAGITRDDIEEALPLKRREMGMLFLSGFLPRPTSGRLSRPFSCELGAA